MRRTLKQVAIFICQIFALYVLLRVSQIGFVLMQIAWPRYLFEGYALPFSVLLVLALSIAASMRYKTNLPVLYAIACLMYAGGFLFSGIYPFAIAGIVMVIASFHSVFPSRFTKPALVLLPVIAGAWIFLTLIATPITYAWLIHLVKKSGGTSSFCDLLIATLSGAVLVTPLVLIYLIANRRYVTVFHWLRGLRPNPTVEGDASPKSGSRPSP